MIDNGRDIAVAIAEFIVMAISCVLVIPVCIVLGLRDLTWLVIRGIGSCLRRRRFPSARVVKL